MAKHTLRYIYIKKIMSKKLTLTEDQLTGIVKKILEQELSDDEVLARLEDGGVIDDETEDEIEKILTPEEIVGLLTEQITQLQDRVQYMEELNADVLEFISFLMQDLSHSPELDLKKSKQKLRALETRAGREIFWLKSRRL
jgi:hypothetical protein|tara:strand:- start:3615 stop:4037 length:423 start_codon:yes stop_codon:yes gene_type:complete